MNNKYLRRGIAIASVCAIMGATFIGGNAINKSMQEEAIRIEHEEVMQENYFVNTALLDGMTENITYLANKESVSVESVDIAGLIPAVAQSDAEQEADRIKKEEEAKRIEEELRQAEARKAVEIAKAKASGVDNSEVEQMTFAQTGDAILTYNVYQKSNLTVEQFNQMLAGTKLAGCGQSYYNMENTYNVNGVFAVALACHESGNGYHTANTHNYYGMRAASGGWKSFSSADANIMYFGQYITGKMYYGKSIENIGKTYCPGTWSSWASAVKRHMNEKWNKITF